LKPQKRNRIRNRLEANDERKTDQETYEKKEELGTTPRQIQSLVVVSFQQHRKRWTKRKGVNVN